MKNDLYKDLENRFNGELTDMRNEIQQIKSSKTGVAMDEDKLAVISSRLDALENPVQSSIVAQCCNEFEGRLSRKKNVMVYGVPESHGSDVKSRKKEDLGNISSIITELSVNIDIDSINCRRMGKFSSYLARPRPLKIFCYSADKAHDFIYNGSRKKSLPSSSQLLKNCLFLPDRTKLQCAQYSQLKSELDQRIFSERNPALRIFCLNGIPKITNRPLPQDSSTS